MNWSRDFIWNIGLKREEGERNEWEGEGGREKEKGEMRMKMKEVEKAIFLIFSCSSFRITPENDRTTTYKVSLILCL